jgi:hypothetical protein
VYAGLGVVMQNSADWVRAPERLDTYTTAQNASRATTSASGSSWYLLALQKRNAPLLKSIVAPSC